MTKVTQISADEEGGPGRKRIHLREISGDSEAPLETVGQDLRAARLRRGDDLATVSRALKIRKDHLAAVEADDMENLPGKTYAIGFVRTYAGYLGLDATQMVERFKEEISGRHNEQASAPMLPDDEGRWLPQGWRIVAGVVVLVLGYGAWHLLAGGPAPQPVPPPPVLNPPHAASKPVPAPAPASTDTTAAPQPVQAAAAPANIPPATAAPVNPAPAAALAKPVPAKPAPGNTASALPIPAVPAARPSPGPGSGQAYGQRNKNARVVLHAQADTHIEVRGENGMIYINQTLKAGDSYRVPNIPGLLLSSTNAGAVQFELDGQMMGRAGTDQETAGDIELDPQAIADHHR